MCSNNVALWLALNRGASHPAMSALRRCWGSSMMTITSTSTMASFGAGSGFLDRTSVHRQPRPSTAVKGMGHPFAPQPLPSTNQAIIHDAVDRRVTRPSLLGNSEHASLSVTLEPAGRACGGPSFSEPVDGSRRAGALWVHPPGYHRWPQRRTSRWGQSPHLVRSRTTPASGWPRKEKATGCRRGCKVETTRLRVSPGRPMVRVA